MYTPSAVPSSADDLAQFLTSELQSIARAFTSPEPYFVLSVLNAAPAKPRDGMIVRADGTHWNPGSGSGFYGYKSGAWSYLG